MICQIPMLFAPDMVAALLNGSKTETRRIFKDAPSGAVSFWREGDADGFWWCHLKSGANHPQHFGKRTQVGDLIWAREAHYAYGYWRTIPDTFTKTGKPKREFVRDRSCAIRFEKPDWTRLGGGEELEPHWYKRPSLFMEKADSRLTLRVTSFSIERLHDIDEAGAIAEGVDLDLQCCGTTCGLDGSCCGSPILATDPVESYMNLWNSINGPDAWDANPWVTVTKFDVIHQNVAEVAA